MPVYNRARFVQAAIDSVLVQTMPDLELLVVDDGSTDDSVACIAAVADPRLRLLRRPHAGISATMNAGLTAARGEYVARLDSDDLWRPELLAVLVPLLDARPDAAAVSARALCITADGTPTAHHLGMPPHQPDDSLSSLLWDDFTCNIATLARRACLERAGGYDESLAVSEDWDLWLRVARQGPILFDDRVLAFVRWHDDNITGIHSPLFRRMLDERARVLDKQFADPNLPAHAAALRAQAYGNVHLASGLRWLVARDVRAAARAFGRALAASDDRLITAARIVWRIASVCILERRAWGRRLLDWQSAVRRRRQMRRIARDRRRRTGPMPTSWQFSSPETGL